MLIRVINGRCRMVQVSYCVDGVTYGCEETGKKADILKKVESRLKKEYPGSVISDVKFVGDVEEDKEEKGE
jgi:hypothetical protein